MNKEQLQFFYDEIMGQLGWGDEQESELTDIDPLIWAKSEMKNRDERAIHYALIVEQFQELLGVYTTTAAFEKIAQLRAELDALKTPSTAGGERATLGDAWCVFPTFGEGGVKWRTMYLEGAEINKQLRAELYKAKEYLTELERAEYHYRTNHDVLGDGDIKTGMAWDWMRKCGDRARAYLSVLQKE